MSQEMSHLKHGDSPKNPAGVSNILKKFESFRVSSEINVSVPTQKPPSKIVLMRNQSLQDCKILNHRKAVNIKNLPLVLRSPSKNKDLTNSLETVDGREFKEIKACDE